MAMYVWHWSGGRLLKTGGGVGFSSLEWKSEVQNLQLGIDGRRTAWKFGVKFDVPVLKVTADASKKNLPQNVDLPIVYPKKKKKPYVTPLKLQRRRPRAGIDSYSKAPANGLLVPNLIPVAHTVMRAQEICEKGVARLVQEIPVKTCRFCTEVHIGRVGHNLGTCQGPKASSRNGLHDWLKGGIDDILVPVEAYHLEDRLDAPIFHDRRFDVERILAVEELCIQAGYENPKYPTKKYTEPVVPKQRKKLEDADWTGEFYDPYYKIQETNTKKYAHPLDETGWTEVSIPEASSHVQAVESVQNSAEGQNDDVRMASVRESIAEAELAELGAQLLEIGPEDDLPTVAERTLMAWDVLRDGARRLMTKYRVVACGYCPEVHVGPRGHRARNCGAFKHQWRDGKHGWQDAAMDELIPPQYVWHLRDKNGPPPEPALKRFYGKTPAIVEMCVQAGAAVPERYKPLMRLDIAIPTIEEVELVV